MKIAIIGYSGCGKSSLAQALAKKLDLPVLYIDTVHHLPGWKVRDRAETSRIVGEFLDAHSESGWVIDSTYRKHHFARRMEEADQILLLRFGRLNCLYRAWKRYRHYKGKSRPSMTVGCDEKFDWQFVRWILWEGRTSHDPVFDEVQKTHGDKVILIRNQRELDAYYRQNGLVYNG